VVWRLVADATWRSRQSYVLMLVVIALLWAIAAIAAIAGQEHATVSRALMMSLMLAYAFGPIGTVVTMSLRELRTLPVTNRDLWVATWVVSTVVVTLALAAAQCLAVIAVLATTGSSAVSTETLLLATLYCFAYAGALSPIAPAMGYSLSNAATRRPRWLWITISVAVVLTFIGAFGLPYYFAEFLPLTLNQFSWTTALALVTCLALAALSLAWTPQRGGFVPAKVQNTSGTIAPSKQSVGFADGLTGIPRVAWPFVMLMLALSAGTLLGFIAYWATFDSGVPLRAFLQDNAVLLFDTGFLPNPDMGRMWIVFLLVSIMMTSPWKPFGRQLRVLPLTTNQVNALLLVTPFAQWALIWLALIATHFLVVGVFPGTLRPDIFVLLGGVTALGHVLMFRNGHLGSMWIPLLIGAFSSLASRILTTNFALSLEVMLIAAGVMALLAAAFINHRTLTRSGSSAKAYRPAQAPFGVSGPAAPR